MNPSQRRSDEFDMRVLIVLGHPNPESFNHAIAQRAQAALRASGHEVLLRDLYAENFDPVMPRSELARDAKLAPEIEACCQEVEEVDGIIIVHPNWWSAPPAIVRGWVDRALRAGRAYNFVPDGKGGAKPVGLLPARAAMVFNTANTPQDLEVSLYGDPLESLWGKVVFGLCGVPMVHRQNFSPVIVSTLEQRQQWLSEVGAAVTQHFPKEDQ